MTGADRSPDEDAALANLRALMPYFTERRRQREERVRAVMAAMTPFERRLASEIVVMAWVEGFMHARAGQEQVDTRPKLPIVIDSCLGMADKYPVISYLLEHPDAPHEAPDWTPEVDLP